MDNNSKQSLPERQKKASTSSHKSQSSSNSSKAQDAATQKARKSTIPEILAPDEEATEGIGGFKSHSNGNRNSMERSSGSSSERPRTSNSQLLQSPSSNEGSDAQPPSPILGYFQDVAASLNSNTKRKVSSKSKDKTPPSPLKNKIKELLGSSEKEQKCPWDLSPLQGASEESQARDPPAKWIKFSVPVTEDESREFVCWPGSQLYTHTESVNWPWPKITYLCNAIPSTEKGTSYLTVILRITSHNDIATVGQAMGCVRLTRWIEDKVSLSLDIIFDEEEDAELGKPEIQKALREEIEKEVRKTLSKEKKKGPFD